MRFYLVGGPPPLIFQHDLSVKVLSLESSRAELCSGVPGGSEHRLLRVFATEPLVVSKLDRIRGDVIQACNCYIDGNSVRVCRTKQPDVGIVNDLELPGCYIPPGLNNCLIELHRFDPTGAEACNDFNNNWRLGIDGTIAGVKPYDDGREVKPDQCSRISRIKLHPLKHSKEII